MVIKYGDLNLLKEYNTSRYFIACIAVLITWTWIIIIDGSFKPILFLPHMLVLIAYVVISDINDERRKHNNRVLYDLLTGYNKITLAARRAQGYVN